MPRYIFAPPLISACSSEFILLRLAAMKEILCRKLVRRNPFKIEHVPWILRVYRYPFDRWATVGKQGLFGVHNFLLYFLYKKLFPFKITGTFLYTINGQPKRIHFNPRNATFHILYFKAFEMGYEPQVAALMDTLMPAKGTYYDIGSNWGWFSLFHASKPGFSGKIHAFEPYPPTYTDITSMVEQAGIGKFVQCHKIALSDEKGEASISLPDHIHSGCATVSAKGGSGTAITQMTTLDDFCKDPPDVMKVDVEGFEAHVLNGAKETLRKYKPMIFFENKRDKDNLSETMQPILILEQLGYVFYHLAWLRLHDGSPCLLGDDLDPSPQTEETLALVPFHSSERMLRHDTMNIFACHKDRVSQVEALCEKRQLA